MELISFNQPIKILVPIGQVPQGSKITKKNGEAIFTVQDEIMVYPYLVKSSGFSSLRQHQLRKESNTRFMLGTTSVEITPIETEVVWLTSINELLDINNNGGFTDD